MIREETVHIPDKDMEIQREYMEKVRSHPNRPNTYFIVTYGCQMNAHDSEKIAGMLETMGFVPARDRTSADLVMHNTCCVRDNAERKALGNVTWLKELKKENSEYIDYSLIAKLESNHIRTNLKYDGVEIHIRSLKEYIDENFKLYAILEKKYLKLCKHCGKAFTAPNPKTEYDTFSCKNQENVYNSSQKKESKAIKN